MDLKDAVEGGGDILAHALKTAPEFVGGHAQEARHGRESLAFLREALRLLVVDILNGMLDVAQEDVVLGKPRGHFGGNAAVAREHLEHRERLAPAKKRITSAADDLKRLREELDLADAAASELDVDARAAAGELASGRLGADHLVQARERRNSVEIQILSEDERTHEGRDVPLLLLEVLRRREDGLVDDAALEPGEALPVAALRVEILLEHVRRAHDRTRLAVRTQAHVDSEDEAGPLDVVQGGNHAPCQPFIELLHGERAAGVRKFGRRPRLAFLVEEEDEVDVGGDVELSAAELAHAHDHQVLGTSRHAVRHAATLGQLSGVDLHRRRDGRLGEVAHEPHDFEVVDATRRVSPDDVHDEAAPHLPELHAQRLAVGRGRRLGLHGLPRERLLDDPLKMREARPSVLSGMHGRQRPCDKGREADDVLKSQ